MREFKINKRIKLRLEGEKTSIFINEKVFMQCKYLLLIIPQNTEIQENSKSIDDFQVKYNSKLEEIGITPEEEFWGHCSNIQAWVENEYDTRLLHSKLAFPLLKKLADSGDNKARLRFKEELVKRLKSDSSNVLEMFLEENYLKLLTSEELYYGILKPEEAKALEEIEVLTLNNFGLVKHLEDLRKMNNDGYLGHYSVKNGKIIELELLFDKYKSERLPFPIYNLKNLKKLYMHISEDNKLFPEAKKELKTIKELRIFSYGPTKISDSFDKYPNLKSLYISGGNFEGIPESIGKLKDLKILIINYSKIEALPKSIGNLSYLEYLDLRGCSLKIPNAITKINSLKTLLINPNLINDIIKSWLKLHNLHKTSDNAKYAIFKKTYHK